jgi:hypothetical protein
MIALDQKLVIWLCMTMFDQVLKSGTMNLLIEGIAKLTPKRDFFGDLYCEALFCSRKSLFLALVL